MNERICFRMCFAASTCFHAEAPSNNPARKVAHSLHYPIDVTILIVSQLLTGLVYNLPYAGRGIKFCNEVQDTAPEFPSFGINFTNDVSFLPGREEAGAGVVWGGGGGGWGRRGGKQGFLSETDRFGRRRGDL